MKFLKILILQSIIVIILNTDASGRTSNTPLYFDDSNSKADTTLANEYFNEGANLYSKAKYDSSITFFEMASNIYKDSGIWEKYISAERRIAVNFMSQAKYNESMQVLKKILNIALEKLGKGNSMISKLYSNLGVVHFYMADYYKSIDYENRALKLKMRDFDNNFAGIALSYGNLAAYYERVGEYDLVFENFEKSLLMQKEKYGDDHPELAIVYANLGVSYFRTMKYQDAIENYRKALAINLKHKGDKHPEVGRVYNNLSLVYSERGDYDKALEYVFKALEIYIDLLGEEHDFIGGIYNNISITYSQKEQYDKSLEYLLKALSIRIKMLGEEHSDVAKIYNNLGNCYVQFNDFEKAIIYQEKALAIQTKVLGKDHPECAYSFDAIGDVFSKLGDYKKSIENYNNALNIRLQKYGKNHLISAKSYNSIAKMNMDFGKYKEALRNVQSSIISLIPAFDNSNHFTNPILKDIINEQELFNSLVLKAEILTKYYSDQTENIKDLEFAVITYSLVFELANKLRISYKAEGSKLFFTQQISEIYNQAIRSTLELYNKTKKEKYRKLAFIFSEQNKIGVLWESLAESNAKKFSGISDSLLKNEKNLRIDLVYYNTELNKEKRKEEENQDSSKIKKYEDKFFDLNLEHQDLLSSFEKNHPDYYQLKYNTKVVDLKTVQSKLDGNEVLIEYVLSDTTLLTFVIDSDEFNVLSTSIDSIFHKNIGIIKQSLNSFYFMKDSLDNYKNFLNASSNLYSKLIEPVENIIQKKKLIIIPDGALGYIPFEILLTENVENEEIRFNDLPYLIKEHVISYNYSATIYNYLLNREKNSVDKTVLALSPSFESNKSFEDRFLADLQSRGEFSELKGAKEETIMINEMFGGDLYRDSTATESLFKEIAHNYKILHIATHGVINDENPMLSKLLFYQGNDTTEDGLLNVSELFNMELNAELAVLSACNTGYGKLYKGEGIISLARGFLYAGVPSIVMSLWKVSDKRTAKLMEKFYENLQGGMDKDEALRKAKLDYLANSNEILSNPYFWAAFVNIGNNEPIDFEESTYYWWFLVLLAGLIAFGFYYVRIVKQKTTSSKYFLQNLSFHYCLY